MLSIVFFGVLHSQIEFTKKKLKHSLQCKYFLNFYEEWVKHKYANSNNISDVSKMVDALEKSVMISSINNECF